MAKKDSKDASDASWLSRELFGLIFIFLGLLLILSLATFDARDPWLNQVISGKITKVHNKAGLFGSYVGGMLFDVFGIAAWMAPFYFCLLGARRILGSAPWPWWRWVGVVLMCLCFATAGGARDAQLQELGAAATMGAVSNHGGGLLGFFLYSSMVNWLGPTGSLLLWILTSLAAIQMLVGFSWLTVVVASALGVWRTCLSMAESVDTQRQFRNTPVEPDPAESAEPLPSAPLFRETPQAQTEDTRLLEERPQKASLRAKLLFWKQKPSSLHNQPEPLVLYDDAPPSSSPDDQQDVPPWVSDFEQERFGVAAPSSALEHEKDTPQLVVSSRKEAVLSKEEQHALADPLWEGEEAEKLLQSFAHNSAVETDEPAIAITQRTPVVQAVPEKKSPLKELFSRKALLPLPLSDLLEAMPVAKAATTRAMLEAKGKSVIACLNDFGISCELVGITPGPVVTMFEIRPAPGVRVSRIANLSDDLALALKAIAVRVQAPIPGTDTVGIEIPNEIREMVCFKELIQSTLFQKTPMRLPLALGKDIAGSAYVADLASMPHLLVAGATGAGKSVGINSILLSILYKARPEEVKLLLVDPKRVEMAIYADLPHLVHPVVTEMSLAKNALDWAVAEMDKRYTDLARAGVRNITDYNAKLAEYKGSKIPDELIGLLPMPYLIIVIDELADLMLVGSKEVETSIVRLAQLARAAGIHLILATQRPSVDVVTGLIKANFPCRIAFQVTSKHDSRTILDAVGAEYLLGKGDMLFKPSGGRFLRLHGAFVSDKNVVAVCDYWRARQKPDYQVDFAEFGAAEAQESAVGGDDVVSDPLYAEASEFVRQQGKVSISLIQRRFRIGCNNAARFVDQMEHDGIISPADGSKPRQVMR